MKVEVRVLTPEERERLDAEQEAAARRIGDLLYGAVVHDINARIERSIQRQPLLGSQLISKSDARAVLGIDPTV